MPTPIDSQGLLDPTTPYNPTDSTTVTTIPGQGAVSWERAHDPRALYLPMLQGTAKSGRTQKLARGYLVQDHLDPAVLRNKHGRALGLRFLYNPTTIQVSYSLNTDIYPTDAAPGSGVPLIGVPGAATVSFDLILDRTYDVWKNPRHPGIGADIGQLLAMVQYSEATPFIQPVAMWAVFGNRPRYYGFITSFGVVYTNWTQSMIPYRGALSGIQFQVLPTSNHRLAVTDVLVGTGGVSAATAAAASGGLPTTASGTGRTP